MRSKTSTLTSREYALKRRIRRKRDCNVFWCLFVSFIIWTQIFMGAKQLPNIMNYFRNSLMIYSMRTSFQRPTKIEVDNFKKESMNKVGPETNGLFVNYDPLYGFVLINGYRMDVQRFAAVGLGSLALRNTVKFGSCQWVTANGSSIEGKITAIYPGEHHELKYETVVLHCTFLEIANYNIGGRVYFSVDGQQVLAYVEEEDYENFEKVNSDFAYQVAFCSPPIYGIVENTRIHEWIQYHLPAHFDYLVMYDAGGVDVYLKKIFETYVKKGVMNVIDVHRTLNYETWMYTQVALMNDCAYRMRYHAKWVMFMDLDEYWTSNSVKLSLPSLLNNFLGNPYVTFGSLWWSIDHCEENQNQNESNWPIKQMVFHQPYIYCIWPENYKREMCLDYFGHRKFAVNPRLVASLNIHRSHIPQTGGVDLDADVAHINHYKGLIRREAEFCKNKFRKDESDGWWVKGYEISNLVKSTENSL